jgi:hypothetical protein
VPSTGGGDAPECYELALKEANKCSWTKDCSKAFVMIGDQVPHPPSYTTSKINWFDETDRLAEKGVKIYGVRALSCNEAIPFYEELSERTGGVSINFHNFALIVDMFLAICYREASPEKLQEFKEEIQSEGKMEGEMGVIFETLSKPNMEKKDKKELAKRKLKSTDPWYDISKDWGAAQYQYSKATKSWERTGTVTAAVSRCSIM